MNAANFTWCDKSLSDANMMIGSISGAEGTMTPASVSFTTATTPTSNTKKFVTYNYEQTIQFEFSIVKNYCKDSNPYISAELDRYLHKWLIREDGFHKIMFDAPGYETIYFNCYLNMTPLYISGNIAGYTIIGVTDSPYPYDEDITHEFSVDSSHTYSMLTDSDVIEYIYPTITITPKASGEMTFRVVEDTRTEPTKFTNVVANSPITIDCEKSIITGVSPSEWNWMFPRLLQKEMETLNTISSSIPCDVVLTYKPRRKTIL